MAVAIIDPFDSQMPFPIDLRMVHQNVAQRDNVPSNARYEGLLVYITGEDNFYYLKDGIQNTNWTLFGDSDGGSEFIQTVYYNSTQPTNQGKNGDIWFRPFNDQIQLYYRVADVWGMIGSWETSGGADSLQDESISFDETSASMQTKFPTVKVGDSVYSNTNNVVYTKKTPTRWTMESLI